MAGPISVISERFVPRRPSSDLHPATAFTTSRSTDTAAGFSVPTPGRRHHTHVAETLIVNAVEPLKKKHGPVIDVQQLRFRSRETVFRGQIESCTLRSSGVSSFVGREELSYGQSSFVLGHRSLGTGLPPRDPTPASRRRSTAMREPSAAPSAARCNPGRVCGPGYTARGAEKTITRSMPKPQSSVPSANTYHKKGNRCRSDAGHGRSLQRFAFATNLRPHRSGSQHENAPGRPGTLNAAVVNGSSGSME